MPTLLHISDLHRTSGPYLNNDELLAAIAGDATRWDEERIPRPDLIVVSGDLIQGSTMDAPDPDSEIAAQYIEAGNFLQRLAAKFVDSDRSRVIIVPGNHDVHRGLARRAMNPLTTCPTGIASKALEANSRVRWNWREQKAYEISDSDLYDSRFEHFRRFQADFYAGLEPNPLSHCDGDLVFTEHPSLGIVVAGFASWQGNDCFCDVGEIDSKSLSSSRELLEKSKAPVAVAVWHHSIVGGPRAHDYMDQRVVHKLIDFGFRVGLHGHQHYPGAAPFELRLPNLTSMAVIGAGSLAVGDSELPMGEHRQFNIVVIDPASESVTVHVRAMSPGGVFSGSHRDDFGGNTFTKLNLPPSPSRPKTSPSTQRLDEALKAVAVRQYEKALELLPEIPCSQSHVKRQIKIKALEGLGRQEALIEFLDPPQTVGEVVQVISLLLDAQRFDEAGERLEAASALVDRVFSRELTETIAARRMMS